MPPNLLTTEQVRVRLGLDTTAAVLHLIQPKKNVPYLKAIRFGRAYAVAEEDLEEFIRNRPKRGRPKVKA